MIAAAAAQADQNQNSHATIFRRAGPGDLGVLKPLYRSTFNDWARSLGRDANYTSYDWLADCVDEGTVWVAKNGEQILGAITLTPNGDTWSIDEIAVSPLLQRRGIGSWMLSRVMQIAPKHGVRRLALCTAKQRKDLVGWYGRSGFKAIRDIPASRYCDGQLQVNMEKRLS